MAFKIGTGNINKLFLGSTLINKVMLGAVQVYTGVVNFLVYFDSTADLTDNFVSTTGTNATQTVTGGVVQFRNGTFDQANYIRPSAQHIGFKSIKIGTSLWAGGSAIGYHTPNFGIEVINSSGTIVDSLRVGICFSYNYNSSSIYYWNDGYMFVYRTSETITSGTAASYRAFALPSNISNIQRTYEIIDDGDGYLTIKFDGATSGYKHYLGDPSYRLQWEPGVSYFNGMSGWYNNTIYCNLDYIEITY